jgi:hypothetical protein
MNQCKQCGATLPENTRVCLQCGTDNPLDSAESQPQGELDFLKPAMIGGAALGITASVVAALQALVPATGILGACCCLWICGAGAYATVLLNKQRPGTLKYGDGALVGAFTGVFGAVISTIIGIPMRLLMTKQLEEASEQLRQAQLPPGLKEFFLQMTAPGINLTFLMIALVMGIVLNAIFASVGGTLTVAILNRKKTE